MLVKANTVYFFRKKVGMVIAFVKFDLLSSDDFNFAIILLNLF